MRAPVEDANVSVTMLHLSNIAWKLDRTLHLDKRNGHILGDDKAMAMWGRDTRRAGSRRSENGRWGKSAPSLSVFILRRTGTFRRALSRRSP